MAAPEFVPTTLAEQPRTGLQLPPARRGRELVKPAMNSNGQPDGDGMGTPGPDQGFALRIARKMRDEIQVAAGEHVEDAIAGCLNVALRRAALFGRAPTIHDLRVAFRIFGYLGGAPDELVQWRRPLFEAAHHHYWDQRSIVDLVPDETLRLPHGDVERRFPSEWKALLGLG